MTTLSSGGHTTNTFVLNYRVCNVILASSGLILNFLGPQGARNFTGGAVPLGTAPELFTYRTYIFKYFFADTHNLPRHFYDTLSINCIIRHFNVTQAQKQVASFGLTAQRYSPERSYINQRRRLSKVPELMASSHNPLSASSPTKTSANFHLAFSLASSAAL